MKFFHIADVHLGAAPDVGCSWSTERKDEIWDTFRKLISKVKAEKIDLLLIAGDLFHGQPLVRELKEVNYLFTTIPDTKVVLIAGNHDFLKIDSHYQTFPWAENVLGLWSKDWSRVYLEDLDTYIYGLSYYSREIEEPLYQYIKPDTLRPEAVHILLGHGGDAKHIPLQPGALVDEGFDYVALGHIHKPEELIHNRAAYAGALEPIDRNDIGKHGFIRGKIEDGDVKIEFVPFAQGEYVVLDIPVDTQTTQTSLGELIRETIEEENRKDAIWKIHLVGKRAADMEFRTELYMGYGKIIQIEDFTKPDYDLEELKEQYKGSLIEEYIHAFEDAPKLPVNEKALEYGLWAMLETKG
ncbi:MAG: DNA repair exonuclease [Lachnospiraceae bacterium]|nr:DNA repair exonuclease [Lachnospiraceae bacterium]MDD3614723.1 DNA repair exonuclease [Lachnospiraceae bacterium]